MGHLLTSAQSNVVKMDISIIGVHLLLESRLSSIYSDEDKPHNFLLSFLPENRVLASSSYLKVAWHSSLALFFLPKPTNLHFRMSISPHTRVALGLRLRSEIYKLHKTSLAINFYVCPLFSSLVQTLNPL